MALQQRFRNISSASEARPINAKFTRFLSELYDDTKTSTDLSSALDHTHSLSLCS